MARTSKHHMVLTDGKGRCSVPMWMNGMPAGFCDRPAFGFRPKATTRRINGEDFRDDLLYAGYIPGLACEIHGGPKDERVALEMIEGDGE